VEELETASTRTLKETNLSEGDLTSRGCPSTVKIKRRADVRTAVEASP
jgi:hypothetical protein